VSRVYRPTRYNIGNFGGKDIIKTTDRQTADGIRASPCKQYLKSRYIYNINYKINTEQKQVTRACQPKTVTPATVKTGSSQNTSFGGHQHTDAASPENHPRQPLPINWLQRHKWAISVYTDRRRCSTTDHHAVLSAEHREKRYHVEVGRTRMRCAKYMLERREASKGARRCRRRGPAHGRPLTECMATRSAAFGLPSFPRRPGTTPLLVPAHV